LEERHFKSDKDESPITRGAKLQQDRLGKTRQVPLNRSFAIPKGFSQKLEDANLPRVFWDPMSKDELTYLAELDLGPYGKVRQPYLDKTSFVVHGNLGAGNWLVCHLLRRIMLGLGAACFYVDVDSALRLWERGPRQIFQRYFFEDVIRGADYLAFGCLEARTFEPEEIVHFRHMMRLRRDSGRPLLLSSQTDPDNLDRYLRSDPLYMHARNVHTVQV